MNDLIAVSKPLYGRPCNGCGWCCQQQPCILSIKFLGSHKGPCRALEIEGGRSYCGLVRNPALHILGEQNVPESKTAEFSVWVASMLGLGMGCDSSDPHQHFTREGAA